MDEAVATDSSSKTPSGDRGMGRRPTAERPAAKPEIISPCRAEACSASRASHVWVSFNTRGDGRSYAKPSGKFEIILTLLLGIPAAAMFAIVFATILIWAAVIGALIALLVLTALILRYLRLHR